LDTTNHWILGRSVSPGLYLAALSPSEKMFLGIRMRQREFFATAEDKIISIDAVWGTELFLRHGIY